MAAAHKLWAAGQAVAIDSAPATHTHTRARARWRCIPLHEDQLDGLVLEAQKHLRRVEARVHLALREIRRACARRGRRRRAHGLVDARLDEVAEVVLARLLVIVEADLDKLGHLEIM